jgi:hypothetical protein
VICFSILSIAARSPMNVDGGSGQLRPEGKDVTPVSSSTGKKFTVKLQSCVSSHSVSVEKVKSLAKVKAEKSNETWNLVDFERDKSYFELTFNIPN